MIISLSWGCYAYKSGSRLGGRRVGPLCTLSSERVKRAGATSRMRTRLMSRYQIGNSGVMLEVID